MQLQNIECQIAKGQIGRYLAGDPLSDEAVGQLEAHIAGCDECRAYVAHRKAALQEMLQGESPEPISKRAGILDLIRKQMTSRGVVQAVAQAAPSSKSSVAKPLVFSAALALVLIGMSYLSKNLGSITGPKVAPMVGIPKPTPTPAPPVRPGAKPAPKPVAKPKPTAKVPAKTTRPVAKPKPASQPKATPSRPTPSPRTRSHPAPEIRIYAPEPKENGS